MGAAPSVYRWMGDRAAVAMRTTYDDLPALADVVAGQLASADVTLALGPPGRIDLALLETLARLALVARRCRGRLTLDAGEEVARLAELTGLSAFLGQPDRHAEPRDGLLPEEVVDVGDPPR